ncbi:MAG: sel1 repeat family protein [Chitinophagaceae bacterium]|nr:sel1 repeat family protein [Chitinophagaceae bacterium]
MESQFNIGFFYANGEYVKQDYKKAFYWYSLAAPQGDTEALRDLGYLYSNGLGIKRIAKLQLNGTKELLLKTMRKHFIIWGFVIKKVTASLNQHVGQNIIF